MDSPPPAPGSNRKKGILVWVIIAVACLLTAFIAIISSKNPAPEPNFVWLDQRQFARQMQPGRLKRLYYKVLNFTAPVWKHFARPKTQILIASKILSVHGVTIGQLGIGTTVASNETGAQIWLLSPTELDNLRQRLKKENGIETVNAPRIVTVEGSPASIFSGYTDSKTLAPIGIAMDINPNIVDHQFRLAMNALYTQENDNPTIPVRTNLSAACRVRLSNSGGLLISGPVSKDLNGTNYWLILSPTAIDGLGKPIKL